MSAKRKIDVEESKRLGRIVTKEIDENDPDYEKYPDKTEYVDDFYIKDSWLDNDSSKERESARGIEHFFLYLFFLFFFIPVTFIMLKVFLLTKENTIPLVLFDLLTILIYPCFILRRKDLSLYHKRLLKIVMGNSIVVLIWALVFIIVPMIMNIDVSINKARIALLLYLLLFVFDLLSQVIISNKKEKYKSKSELFDRLSFVLSIATIWAYGAIICPLIFNKMIERIIFDLSLLLFVIGVSIVNMTVYKYRKRKVQEDYIYTGIDFHRGSRMLLLLFGEGIVMGLMCIILICVNF